jgi:hypothetical protein
MTKYLYTPKSTVYKYVHPAAGGWVVYGAFANERSYVKTNLTVRQVETLWAVP